MPRKCEVLGCDTYEGKGIRMYPFPVPKSTHANNLSLAKEWLWRCQSIVAGPLNGLAHKLKKKLICARHFAPDAYKLTSTAGSADYILYMSAP